MKYLNKVVALILCVTIFLNISTVACGTEIIDNAANIKSYVVPVISNEYQNQYVTFYEYDGRYFLDLNDIKDFTRCTLTEDEKSLTLTHGTREIVIDKDTGHMVDCGLVDQGNIDLLHYNDLYLCEGIPMLQYLGAACSIREEKQFEVLMPMYTFWESIMPDYIEYYFDINELYGGEDNVKISLICDIIADILDGVSGHGLLGSYDLHMEDALYEVLNVDMMKYGYVQQSAAEKNQKINDFLTSDVYGLILDGSEKTVDTTYEVLDYYAGFYLNTQIWKNSYLEKLYFDAGDLETASDLGSKINKQVYEQSVIQADLKDVKANKSLLSAGMLAFDTAVTSYGLMQYDDDTRFLFARTINDNMFAHTDYYGVGWKNVADKISNTLKSTESIVANTAAEKVTEKVVEEVAESGLTKAISAFTSKANIYVAAAQIGHFLASLINYNSNQAFSADLNAILLSHAQFDIAMMASQLVVDERDKYQFANVDSLGRIKDMFTLYYRTTIAFSENVAKSIEEFGTKKDQKWVDWFSSTEGWSVANYFADYLYRITNCVIVPIAEYAGISDNVITQEWIQNNGIDVQQELVTDAYFDYIVDEEYNQVYCYHIPQFVLNGGGFEQLNAEIFDKQYTILEDDVYPNVSIGTGFIVTNMSYGCGIKNGYVSLIISTKLDWGGARYYDVFNVNVNDGSRISTQDLLSAYGLSDADYRELARKLLKEKYESNLSEAYEANKSNDNFVKFYQQQRNATISDQNIDAVIPYIDASGDLCCIARIYSIAGADYYHHLVNLTGANEPTQIECTVDHSAERAEPSDDPLQYFIENCDRQYFAEEDVEDFDHQMCIYARNAVFAKSGRIFQSQELQDYFAKYSWYVPRIEPDAFSNNMLNTIQRANVDLILEREEELEIEALVNSLSGEEGIYTRYLHKGGYEEILGSYWDKEKLEISACLVDLDSDGSNELFLHIETGQYGVRGLEAHTVVLDIKDDRVFIAADSYFGGGSEGGAHLDIRYDAQSKKHVLVLDGYSRDGVDAVSTFLEVYSKPGFTLGQKLHSTYYRCSSNWYREAIDEIRSETTLYYMDENDFRCYRIDEQYVTEEAFDNAWARYEDAREGFQLKSGTYVKPIA